MSNGDPDPASGARQTSLDDPLFWTAYVIGIYEYGGFPNTAAAANNDPSEEFAILGFTASGGPEYNIIPMEVIRDVAAQHGWDAATRDRVEQIVVLHEIGHQFGLAHPQNNNQIYPDHIMTVPNGDAGEDRAPEVRPEFIDADIHTIRNHGSDPP